jgi:hypothetical protein
MPDPRDVARAYAQAAERGDADAIYGMMTEEAQRRYGRDGARKLVDGARNELKSHGQAVGSPAAQVRARATVRYEDGEDAELEIEDGRFRVGTAGALPAGARTPAQALAELRAALARRSYSALMRVLSSETRTAIENDLKTLVTGLEQPATLDIKVTGDKAEVQVPGGHIVKLKREDGVWRVEDFD